MSEEVEMEIANELKCETLILSLDAEFEMACRACMLEGERVVKEGEICGVL